MLADVVAIPTDGLILFGIGALIPPITATLTKWHAPDWVKKVVTALLAIAAASVTEAFHAMQSGHDWTFYGVFLSSLIAWLSANVTYVKLWQDTPLMNAIVKKTANLGVSAKPQPWPFPEPKATDLPVVPAVEVAAPASPTPVTVPAQLSSEETKAIVDKVLQHAVDNLAKAQEPPPATDVKPVEERPEPPATTQTAQSTPMTSNVAAQPAQSAPIQPQPAPAPPTDTLNKSIMGFPGRQ